MKRFAILLLAASGCVVTTTDDPVVRPPPSLLADYESCGRDTDCDSGLCEPLTVSGPGGTFSDAICTAGCADSRDCQPTASGLQGTCAALEDGPFLCYETCDSNADCAAGFICGDVGGGAVLCVPGDDSLLADYEACSFDTDCASAQCESVTAEWGDRSVTDSFCTAGCFDSTDCAFTAGGLQGTCAALGGGPFLCYESCDFDTDCSAGFACGDLGTGDTVCLPF